MSNSIHATEEIKIIPKSKTKYWGWIIFILIVLGLTLPFHYVPSALKAFPKDHFTFKHTIITEDDISEIVERYNNSNFLEKNAMNNDPFIQTLREQGFIIDKELDNSEPQNIK